MAPLHRQYKNRANRNSPASAIENKADANSDIGFARLCFVQRCHKGTHTKVLKLSAGLRTQSVECSKLGKTWIITDASCGMVRNTRFCGQICRRMFIWNFEGSISNNITYHPKDVYAYCGSSILLFFHICKLCILRQPYQIDGSDRTISLLGYDDL